ncbi:hypothetical protein KP509_25G045100 [Ceratopteris richardii]|nr:hypothetical protein KP509_25G045100 [Ceratopteris richardii]
MIEKEDGKHRLVAYIVDLYEDRTSHKKMRVQWLHKAGEIEGKIPPPKPRRNEVFMTRYTQVFKLECCDGVVDVLTPEHFEVCIPTLATLEHTYFCGRRFESGYEGVKPFDISSVQGYWNQKIFLSRLIPPNLSDLARANANLYEDDQVGVTNLHEGEHKGSLQVIRSGPKAARSSRRRPGRGDFLTDEGDWVPQEEVCPLLHNSGDDVTSCLGKNSNSLLPTSISGRSLTCHFDLAAVGNKIEILSADSGLRGCWFRCTVVAKKGDRVKVRYDDVEDVDSGKQLEEWMSLYMSAPVDECQVRFPGRPMMRPSPTENEMLSAAHRVGCAVDAFHIEGWWEGILVDRDASGQVQVIFPDEGILVWMDESKVRVSKEWMDGQWSTVQLHENIVRKVIGLHSDRFGAEIRQALPKNNQSLPDDFPSDTEAVRLQHIKNKEANRQNEGLTYSVNKQAGKEGLIVHDVKTANFTNHNLDNSWKLNSSHNSGKPVHQTVTNGLSAQECVDRDSNLKLPACEGLTQVPDALGCEEGILQSGYSGKKDKVQEPLVVCHEVLSSGVSQANCSRDPSDNYGNLQPLESQETFADEHKGSDIVLESGLFGQGISHSKLSRKRQLDAECPYSARGSKSGLFAPRFSGSDSFCGGSQEQRETSVDVLPLSKSMDTPNIDVRQPQYGFNQLNSSSGSSVGGPLFSPVSVQSLVLSS